MIRTDRSFIPMPALARAAASVAMLALALLILAPSAHAQPTAGASCAGPGCKAGDGVTAGGDCFGPYCSAGSAGTGGGSCLGNNCQAGNGRTGGGECVGDGCKAGDGGTMGGSCYGKGCTAGNRANCYGEGCRPGAGGRANPDATSGADLQCCLAWHAGALNRQLVLPYPDFRRRDDPNARLPGVLQRCALLEDINRMYHAPRCSAQAPDGRRVVVAPLPMDARPDKLPPPPTPMDQLPRRQRDPRCEFDCQSWNSVTNSCVGARMNGCIR